MLPASPREIEPKITNERERDQPQDYTLSEIYIYIYKAKGPQAVSAGWEIWDLIIYYTLATLGMWGPST